MSVSPARRSALRVLEQLSRPEAPSVQAALDAALGTPGGPDCARPARPGRSRHALAEGLSPADRALATELVYGVLRVQTRLVWILARFQKQPGKTPPLLRLLLDIAAYEMLYLERIPAHASVDAAVELCRAALGPGLARVANGVLRALGRELESAGRERFAPEWIEREIGRFPEGLAVAGAVPLWMVRLWLDAYGAERTRALVYAAGRTPWSCVRVNAARPEAAELLAGLAAGPDAVRVGAFGVRFAPGSRPAGLDALARQGRLSLQGAGSLLALEALGAYTVEGTLWDACAGRGGKTFALLERGVRVTAAGDTSLARLTGLRRDAARLQLPCPLLCAASAARPPFSPAFRPDAILVDAPCSGLGTLARRPDLRLRRAPEHLPGLLAAQEQILEAAWAVLAPGGRLFYITCAVNPDENEGRIARFLDAHPTAGLRARHAPDPDEAGSDVLFGVALDKSQG